MTRRSTYLLTACLLAVSGSGAVAADDGPRASFAVVDGFLTVRVTRPDGAPVPYAVRAVTPTGHVWAEGTTDDGACEFPRPKSETCRLEFDLGGTPSPPVELTFLDSGTAVVPLVAPLTPGPCCSSRVSSADPGADGRAVDWSPVLIPVSAFLVFLGAIVWAATRPVGPPVRRKPSCVPTPPPTRTAGPALTR